MSRTSCPETAAETEMVPAELVRLRERILAQPPRVRAELQPLIEELMEDARFRGRAMSLARAALERFRLDLKLMEFDRDVTRREREAFRARGG